jgi:hypothetical protein
MARPQVADGGTLVQKLEMVKRINIYLYIICTPHWVLYNVEYAWRGAMLIIAGFVLSCDFFGVFRPVPGVRDSKSVSRKASASGMTHQDLSALKDPIFILFTISNFWYYIPYVYVVAQAEERGIPTRLAIPITANSKVASPSDIAPSNVECPAGHYSMLSLYVMSL